MLLTLLQVVTLVIVAIPMSTAVAHALELPGKRRLGREDYLVVQTIYYPGFTRAGIGEPVAILALLLLLFLTPSGLPFWLTLGALAAMCAMHAIFWIYTQPVNRVWMKDLQLGRADAAFFRPEAAAHDDADWTVLRDRWETSHLARAACAGLAFVLLAIAVAL